MTKRIKFSGNNGLHQQYNVEDQLQANRMAVIANMVGQGGVPPGLGSDPSAAANITAANLANLAMRLGVTQVRYKKRNWDDSVSDKALRERCHSIVC